MTTDDRLDALAERGWRPTVETHLVPRRHPWAEELGITVQHDAQHLVGWTIHLRPGSVLARRGATSRRGGVYATIKQALDWAESHADREAERLG